MSAPKPLLNPGYPVSSDEEKERLTKYMEPSDSDEDPSGVPVPKTDPSQPGKPAGQHGSWAPWKKGSTYQPLKGGNSGGSAPAAQSQKEAVQGSEKMPSQEAIEKILRSPPHLLIKHRIQTVLYSGLIGSVLTVTCVSLCLWLGIRLLLTKRWMIYEFSIAGITSVIWAYFGFQYWQDVRTVQEPYFLKIDIVQSMTALVTSFSLLFYLFSKNQQHPDRATFDTRCGGSGCSNAQYNAFSFLPLATAIILVLIGLLQLYMAYRLYHDPIVNPPKQPKGTPPPADSSDNDAGGAQPPPAASLGRSSKGKERATEKQTRRWERESRRSGRRSAV